VVTTSTEASGTRTVAKAQMEMERVSRDAGRSRLSALPFDLADHHAVFENNPPVYHLRCARVVVRVAAFLEELDAIGGRDLYQRARLLGNHPGRPQAIDNFGFGHAVTDQVELASVDGLGAVGTARQGERAKQKAQQDVSSVSHGRFLRIRPSWYAASSHGVAGDTRGLAHDATMDGSVQ
jgi:hypothetical protein